MTSSQPAVADNASIPDLAPRATVIIATYKGRDRIGTAIDSLYAQSIGYERFEALVIVNGEDDGTAEFLRTRRASWPGLQLRVVKTPVAGASEAWNLGLRMSNFEYVTFLDDDDWVSTTYLEVLLGIAAPHCIAMAPFGDIVDDDPTPSFDNYINRAIFRFGGSEATLGSLMQAAAANCGKLVHRKHVEAVRFDPSMRSGMDVAFWSRTIAFGKLPIRVLPPGSGAVYYRALRDDSMSRAYTAQFATDRVSAIRSLSGTKERVPSYKAPLSGLITAQAHHLGRYIAANPTEHTRVLQEIEEQKIPDFPYSAMNDFAAKTLVVAYAFPPYNDTSAMVVARRIHTSGDIVDVITQDMSNIRGTDPVAKTLVHKYVARTMTIGGQATFGGWSGIERFALEGFAKAKARMDVRGTYETVYSRSMFPASHVLAALIKIRHPEIRWIAEFSDPLRNDSSGQPRIGTIPSSDIFEEIESAAIAAGGQPTTSRVLWEWLENVPFALADSVVFTNANQQEVMLSDLPEAITSRVKSIASIQPHPTLPQAFYSIDRAPYDLASDRVHLGYFGVFYPARGPGDIFSALLDLTTEERKHFALHIFTNDPIATQAIVEEHGLDDSVIVNGYLPYLQFLEISTRFDWLIVADAHTAHTHGINPYLPSKYSDYLGSGSKIWAIVEPGSVLSSIATAARTELGDVGAAAQHLRAQLTHASF